MYCKHLPFQLQLRNPNYLCCFTDIRLLPILHSETVKEDILPFKEAYAE